MALLTKMKGHYQQSRPEKAWLATFADLSAVLLAFFVLTFSMVRLQPIIPANGATTEQKIDGTSPDFASDFSNLTTPQRQLNDRADNYRSILMAQELQTYAEVREIEVAVQGDGVAIRHLVPIIEPNDLSDRLMEIVPILERMQRRTAFEITTTLEGVSVPSAPSWLFNIVQASKLMGSLGAYRVEIADLANNTADSRIYLRLDIAP